MYKYKPFAGPILIINATPLFSRLLSLMLSFNTLLTLIKKSAQLVLHFETNAHRKVFISLSCHGTKLTRLSHQPDFQLMHNLYCVYHHLDGIVLRLLWEFEIFLPSAKMKCIYQVYRKYGKRNKITTVLVCCRVYKGWITPDFTNREVILVAVTLLLLAFSYYYCDISGYFDQLVI